MRIQIRIRIGIQPKMLDTDPDPESMNPDPKHYRKLLRIGNDSGGNRIIWQIFHFKRKTQCLSNNIQKTIGRKKIMLVTKNLQFKQFIFWAPIVKMYAPNGRSNPSGCGGLLKFPAHYSRGSFQKRGALAAPPSSPRIQRPWLSRPK